jgi:hypothetical protein
MTSDTVTPLLTPIEPWLKDGSNWLLLGSKQFVCLHTQYRKDKAKLSEDDIAFLPSRRQP